MKEIVIVEPSAHLTHGHYKDKLTIWLRELNKLGIKTHLISLKKLSGYEVSPSCAYPLSRTNEQIADALPGALSRIYVFTLAYAKGIELSRKLNCGLLGLTTRAALPIWLASLFKGTPDNPWGFHLMNCYLDGIMGFFQRIAFKRLAKKKCHVFANLHENLERLGLSQKPDLASYLPDPISLYDLKEERNENSMRLLVAGKDNARRNGFKTLIEQKLPNIINEVQLHCTGGDDKLIEGFKKRNPHVKVIITEGFCSAEEFYDIFSSADICLISYDPEFPAGSGNLVNAIVAGTRVISSSLSHAIYLKERYPHAVQIFNYKNSMSLSETLNTMMVFEERQEEKFMEEVRALRSLVGAEFVVKRCISILKVSPLVS